MPWNSSRFDGSHGLRLWSCTNIKSHSILIRFVAFSLLQRKNICGIFCVCGQWPFNYVYFCITNKKVYIIKINKRYKSRDETLSNPIFKSNMEPIVRIFRLTKTYNWVCRFFLFVMEEYDCWVPFSDFIVSTWNCLHFDIQCIDPKLYEIPNMFQI